jgi:hypothetical protein
MERCWIVTLGVNISVHITETNQNKRKSKFINKNDKNYNGNWIKRIKVAFNPKINTWNFLIKH